MKSKKVLISIILAVSFILTACGMDFNSAEQALLKSVYEYGMEELYNRSLEVQGQLELSDSTITLDMIPIYQGDAVAIINENNPQFLQPTIDPYEYYSDLDSLGRCQVAEASLGVELMPTGERESISHIKPSGWHSVSYDEVDGGYLYNRCHLIGYQLAGENANEKNLITGTRYMNTPIMLLYENAVADYINKTGNHVMYRVTPMYDGANLLARGVLMEAYSVEDEGEGVCFNVFVYNEQPGIYIDHTTGYSRVEDVFDVDNNSIEVLDEQEKSQEIFESTLAKRGDYDVDKVYILNTNSKKIHTDDCVHVETISEHNRGIMETSINKLLDLNYSVCGTCLK